MMAIESWSVGRTLGCGSTATVSLATSPSSPFPFAVKSADLSRSEPLRHEHSVLSSFSSPHLISCLGAAVSAGRYHLFLEYAPGGSLADAVLARGGSLDEPSACAFARDVLRGLADLHAAGLAHCDVKGRNVLLGPDGHARLADLGCARRLADARDSLVRGTPAFLAPEAARGEEQGAAADIWALGCTVLEMSTGRPPWPDALHPVDALRRIAFGSAVPEPPPGASELAKDFLEKCFRRDPRDRWTAEQLLDHPFIADCCAAKSNPNDDWVSPKSTLDQAFWDSVDEEDSVEQPAINDPSERIRQLACSSGFADWTWDENWITVRGEERMECTANSEPEHGDGNWIPADQLDSERSSDGVTDASQSADFGLGPMDYCFISDRNETDVDGGGRETFKGRDVNFCYLDCHLRNYKQRFILSS